MKNIHRAIQFALTILILTSCTDEKQQQAKFEDLHLSETKTTLDVSYYSADGALIPEGTPLSPNTRYILEIRSNDPVSFKFRKTDGFTFSEDPVDIFKLTTVKKYQIQTTEGESVDPFFSAYPILKSEDGNYVKERPQLFLRSVTK